MRRIVVGLVAAVLACLPAAALAAGERPAPAPKHTAHKSKPTAHKKPVAHRKARASRHWHGYGFLPGYRPPEVIEREREEHYWASGPHFYGPAWPRFYRGRWNGGGFGPCYTQTPIGYMWNCGM